MYIRYKLFRSSKKDEVFNAEMIEVVLENDDHLARIDEIIQGVLVKHIQELPEVKKFGIAYVDRMEVTNIEITDKDNVNLTEEAFRHYMSTILPHISIVWNQTSNNIAEDKTELKTDFNENKE